VNIVVPTSAKPNEILGNAASRVYLTKDCGKIKNVAKANNKSHNRRLKPTAIKKL